MATAMPPTAVAKARMDKNNLVKPTQSIFMIASRGCDSRLLLILLESYC
jgi:hypothetical protein